MRIAEIKRKTKETDIFIKINLDGSGEAKLDTGIGFFNHMLEQIARHGLIDLEISCKGDLEVDFHHSVEDVGIALGSCFLEALGDKRGILRYGYAYTPLDEALSRVVIDFSGRASLNYFVDFPSQKIGEFDTELFSEFFQGFANNAKATLHLDNLRGKNSHHIIESLFKAFGRALRMAISIDERAKNIIPSTKGVL